MNFWIRDDVGRVLGPIGLGVLRDLVSAGRIARIQEASRNGSTFVPVADIAEIADLIATEARRTDDRLEAERIATLLHEMKSKETHEVFELVPTATLEDYKAAFFRLAKHYHPDRLGADALPELRLAYDSLFHFLATTMATVELRIAPRAQASPPSSARPVGSATGRYAAEAFVGIVDRPDGQKAFEVRISPATIGVFVENELVNLAKDGVFLPAQQGLALGSTVELTFLFDAPARQVSARGRVVFENSAGRGKPGVGIKFLRLSDEDRAFLMDYVKRVQSAKR